MRKLFILLGFLILTPVIQAKTRYYAWVNRPLVIDKNSIKLNLYITSTVSSKTSTSFGILNTLSNYDPSGLQLQIGFKGAEFDFGYAGAFSYNNIKSAPILGQWPQHKTSSSLNLISLGTTIRITHWWAIKGTLMLDPQFIYKDGCAFAVSMPFRAILSPGLLSVHLVPQLLMGSGNGGTLDAGYTAGIKFSLLPQLLLSEDFVMNIAPYSNSVLKTGLITALGWSFMNGVDIIIKHTYWGIDYSDHVQAITIGTSIFM